MKRFLLFCLITLISIATWAADFEVNGMCYNITTEEGSTNLTVETTYSGSSQTTATTYEGDIVIPSTVDYDGNTYTVTGIGGYTFYNPKTNITSITLPETITYIGQYGLYYCSGLTELIIPNGVTEIGQYALYYCTALTALTIPDSVTSLGSRVFYGCSALTSLTLSKSLTTLPDNMCYGCSALTSVTIPDNVESIEQYAFYNCSKIEAFVIPQKVASLGNYTFSGCSALSSIEFEEGSELTTLGTYVFRNCTSLTELVLPDGVTKISDYEFYGCSKLEKVTIGSIVATVGQQAFYNCSALSVLTSRNATPPTVSNSNAFTGVPTSTCVLSVPTQSVDLYKENNRWSVFTNIEGFGYTFSAITYDATDLTNSSATLNAVVTAGDETIIEQGFEYWASSDDVKQVAASTIEENMSVTVSGLETNTKYTFRAYAKTTTETAYGQESTFTTGNYDFGADGVRFDILTSSTCEVVCGTTSYNAYSGSINIPSTAEYGGVTYTVVRIGDNAFRNCSALTDVTIPNTVTEFGTYVFYGCSILEELTIPNSVVEIGQETFEGCDALKKVVFEENSSLKNFPNYMFYACKAIEEITIPKSVETFGGSIFYNCTALTKVTFEENSALSSTGTRVFRGCSALEEALNIPIAGEEMFYQCTSLKTATFAENELFTSIAKNAFYHCEALEDISIPTSVTEIGQSAFQSCLSMKGLILPTGIEEIGQSAFNTCESITEVYIPASVVEMGMYVFDSCTNLEKVTFDDDCQIETINPGMFEYCDALKEVHLPESVWEIGGYVFRGCISLEEFEFTQNVTWLGSYTFQNCTALKKVTVPGKMESMEAYLFDGCSSLTEFTIPNSVTTFGNYVFRNCTSLKEIAIPDAVTSLGTYTFYGCSNLEKVSMSSSSKLTSLQNYTFQDCTSLTDIAIPESITSMAQSVFAGCTSLKEIVIPKNMETIGNSSFNGCTILSSIYSMNPEPPVCGETVFEGVNVDACVLTVPAEALYSYANADTWQDFLKDYSAPSVTTYEATDIDFTSVTISGSVVKGSEDIKEQGLEYWASDNDVQTIEFKEDDMTATLELPCGVLYTYRAYATTASVTIYGEEFNFTVTTPPSVKTYAATDVTSNSALIKGYVVTGSEEIDEQGFEYWVDEEDVLTILCEDEELMALTLSDLDPETKYTYHAYATTVTGTIYGEDVTFTTVAKDFVLPTVVTYEATDISSTSALIKGFVEAGTEDIVEQGFEYWTGEEEPESITSDDNVMALTLYDLEPETTYSYRAYATTESDTTYGEEMTFTTRSKGFVLPTVVTYEATDISSTSALIKGFVEAGTEDIVEQGFEYWTEEEEPERITSDDNVMALTLYDLEPETIYTYRAYATTESGTTYGEEMTFTTRSKDFVLPTVVTYLATDITSTSALIKGFVEAGTEDIVEQGFEYWTEEEEPESITSDDNVMALILAGLNPETTYTYRAYAITESGTTYGEDMEFTTLEDSTTGINGISVDDENVEGIYSTSGQKLNSTQKGVNIIRYSDGSVKKIYVK